MSHVTLSPVILRTEVGDVLQHSRSMGSSSLLHLTNLLPFVVLVVPQDVLQKIFVIDSTSCKYIIIYVILYIIYIVRYNEMFNIDIIENVLTKHEDVILH